MLTDCQAIVLKQFACISSFNPHTSNMVRQTHTFTNKFSKAQRNQIACQGQQSLWLVEPGYKSRKLSSEGQAIQLSSYKLFKTKAANGKLYIGSFLSEKVAEIWLTYNQLHRIKVNNLTHLTYVDICEVINTLHSVPYQLYTYVYRKRGGKTYTKG